MKKSLAFLLALLMCIGLPACTNTTSIPTTSQTEEPSYKEAETQANFHYSNWGMNKEEVIQAETELTLVDYDDYLIAEDTIVAQTDASLLFVFNEGKLVSGMVQFKTQHSNENLYLDDYDAIKDSLTEKYGTPSVDKKQWKDTLYQDDPEDWGFAVSLGDLILISSWETNTTKIEHILIGDNYEITHGILYTQIGYQTERSSDGL